MREKPWYVYVLLCKDNSLYCGISPDVEARLDKHNAGQGAKYTQARRPCRLVAAWRFDNCSAAASAEAKFKQQDRSEKIASISKKTWGDGIWSTSDIAKMGLISSHKSFEEDNNAL